MRGGVIKGVLGSAVGRMAGGRGFQSDGAVDETLVRMDKDPCAGPLPQDRGSPTTCIVGVCVCVCVGVGVGVV